MKIWQLLGIEPTDQLDAIKSAYRRQLRSVHPDVNDRPDATLDVMRLHTAYQVASKAAMTASQRRSSAERTVRSQQSRRVVGPSSWTKRTLDASSLVVMFGLDRPQAVELVTLALAELGHISYLDRSSGSIQVVLKFVEAPPCYLSAEVDESASQSDGSALTAITVWIDSLEARPAPHINDAWHLVEPLLRSLSGELTPPVSNPTPNSPRPTP